MRIRGEFFLNPGFLTCFFVQLSGFFFLFLPVVACSWSSGSSTTLPTVGEYKNVKFGSCAAGTGLAGGVLDSAIFP